MEDNSLNTPPNYLREAVKQVPYSNVLRSGLTLMDFVKRNLGPNTDVKIFQFSVPYRYSYAVFILNWDKKFSSHIGSNKSVVIVVCDKETDHWFISEQAIIQIEQILYHTSHNGIFEHWFNYTEGYKDA